MNPRTLQVYENHCENNMSQGGAPTEFCNPQGLEVAACHAPLVVCFPKAAARLKFDLPGIPVEGEALLVVRDDWPPSSVVLVEVLDLLGFVSTLPQTGDGPVVDGLLSDPARLSHISRAVDLQVRGGGSISIHLVLLLLRSLWA